MLKYEYVQKKNFIKYIILRLAYTIIISSPILIFNPISIFSVIFLLIIFQLSHDLSIATLLHTFKPNFPKASEKITKNYKVAILYLCKNEYMEKAIKSMVFQTYPSDVFIIDASTKKNIIQELTEIAKKYRIYYIWTGKYDKIKKKYKSGKAFDINLWIEHFGNKYDIVILADSDSVFPEDFVESMLKYIDHPENKDIAIFQALTLPYYETKFGKIVAGNPIVSYKIQRTVGTNLPIPNFFGHNAAIRTKIFRYIKFDPRHVSEDWKLLVDILKLGFKSAVVDVISYESVPSNLEAYIKRYRKWMSGKLEHFTFLNRRSIMQYIFFVTYFLSDLQMFLYLVIPILILISFKYAWISLPLLIYGLFIMLGSYVLARLLHTYLGGKINAKEYILSNAISIASAIYFLPSLINRKFLITPKNKKGSVYYILRDYLLYLVILVSVSLYNLQMALINFWWMFYLYITPILIATNKKMFDGEI